MGFDKMSDEQMLETLDRTLGEPDHPHSLILPHKPLMEHVVTHNRFGNLTVKLNNLFNQLGDPCTSGADEGECPWLKVAKMCLRACGYICEGLMDIDA